jgi:hypothetical protein
VDGVGGEPDRRCTRMQLDTQVLDRVRAVVALLAIGASGVELVICP